MRASDVTRILANKHVRDLFAEEVATSGAGTRRLDAVAIPRSWSRWTVVGYEIKVSRADFLKDNKMHEYREYVHELYVVAPDGVLEPRELPEGVGWMRVTANGERTLRKVKAVRVDRPERIHCLYHSLAINRMRLVRYDPSDPENRRKRIAEMLYQREQSKDIGRIACKWISDRHSMIATENARLKSELDRLLDLRQYMKERGITSWDIEQKGERLKRALNEAQPVLEQLVRVRALADQVIGALESMKGVGG